MEAVRSTEICVIFYRTTRGYIPEDSNLQSHRCENLKYNKNSIQLLRGKS
jgi:hypothetical protein